MPFTDETQARINLLIGLDRATLRHTRNSLDALFGQRRTLEIDDAVLKDFASTVKRALSEGGSDVDAALAGRFDVVVGDLLQQFGSIQEELKAAVSADDEVKAEALMLQQQLLSRQIDAEADAHKQRLDAAKKLKESLQPDLTKFGEGAITLGQGFLDVLNQAKSQDLAGFTKGVLGAIGSRMQAAASSKTSAAGAAADAAQAEKLLVAANALSMAAGVLAVAGGALAAIVTLLKAADDQAKEMNRTLLEGASMVDFAFKGNAARLMDVTEHVDAARKAAFQLASEFRGDAKEYAAIIAQLNQAGFSYQEITKAAGRATSETQALADAARLTFVYSQALGVSVGELADVEAEWSRTFGFDLARIEEGFATIAGFAMEGGFNVKRFFTAVSQATAGMAIYNVRMEEAAGLLAKTSKILGDTDASDFIRSLTQGFADEGMTERMKRIMIAGAADTQRIFDGTAERTAKSFVETFSGSGTQKALEGAFSQVKGFNVDVLQDPKKLADTWGKLSAVDRRLVIGQLRDNGDEQSAAASRQLDTLSRVVDGANKGFDAQVKGLSALDMQGKLAYKLQTLGDRNLSDMSSIELAAFEQYAGISGAQLEQLMRVESQLQADYELAKKEGRTTASSFKEYIATSEDAAGKLDEVKEIEDQATWFARSTVKNTRSIFDLLQNTIASILNDIYGLMGTWFASSKGLSKTSMDKQNLAVVELEKQRDSSTKYLESVNDRLAKLDETISTTGENSQEHQDALAERTAMEAKRQQALMTNDYLSAKSRQVFLLDEAQMQKLGSSQDVLNEVARSMTSTGEDIAIATRYMTTAETDALKQSKKDVAMQVPGVRASAEMLQQGTLGKLALKGAILDEKMGLYDLLGVKGPEASMKEAQDAQSKVVSDLLLDDQDLSEEQVKTLMRQEDVSAKALKLSEKDMQRDKKFQESFPDANEKSTFEAMKLYEGWKIGVQQGFTGSDLGQVAQEWASGDTMSGRGKLAARLGMAGIDVKSLVGGGGSPAGADVAHDFIMRPGQPAQFIDPKDTLYGMKPGGPVDRQSGGHVVVNVYGGDQAAVYRTVKEALKNSGLRP